MAVPVDGLTGRIGDSSTATGEVGAGAGPGRVRGCSSAWEVGAGAVPWPRSVVCEDSLNSEGDQSEGETVLHSCGGSC